MTADGRRRAGKAAAERADLPPPTDSPALRTARVVASLVPYVGGAVSELIDAKFGAPLRARMDAFLRDIFAELTRLSVVVDGFALEDLDDNEAFQSVTAAACQSVLRDHREEKIRALHHAVINAAFEEDVGVDRALLFVSFVDQLQPAHLQRLGLLRELEADPSNFMSRTLVRLRRNRRDVVATLVLLPFLVVLFPLMVIAMVLDEFDDRLTTEGRLSRRVHADLVGLGLAYGTWASLATNARLTPLGHEFLRYIEKRDTVQARILDDERVEAEWLRKAASGMERFLSTATRRILGLSGRSRTR